MSGLSGRSAGEVLERLMIEATPAMTDPASDWKGFSGKETVRCVCGRPFGEVAPGVRLMVRIRPPFRAVGERHFTHTCRSCRKQLDVLVIPD